ncbi:hypothetical protein CDO44_03200 [Pigmentiphaga sp. NML080357]|uniref:DUF1178 family protein n=1 Tax=Pigmentiphaga sp. NML080357 TaxID=2008675 RepID=UPI000B41EBDA|nr:DUF1178 family protein [Pigmentiphaga sp. NML080357]OVZ63759.1 hypothetical protein CDO44_03200 [Pigmentiphaga sp. NML080357]
MAFKVFDLQCEHGHVFEGWFSSHSDFDTQRERGLISCPLCDSKSIDKKLSAPMLNVSGSKAPSEQAAVRDTGKPAAMQAAMLQHLRQLLRQTENVGERFAAEARRIHHGEAPERPIRGVATHEERQSLAEEGIAVAAIPALLDDERLQ